jgi:hypothetical protein
MPLLRPWLAALVVAVAFLGASCSDSGGGSVTLPSGVTRPTDVPTTAPADGSSNTRPPATEAPATQPPRTEAPATEPPRTEAPATTAAPPIAAPGTTTAPAGEGNGTTWWPWLLVGLAVVAIIVGIVLFLRSRRAPGWPADTATALDDSDEITTHLVGLAPGGLGAVARADATRLAALMASVQQLVASAPDDPSRRALGEVQEPLRSLHGAVDAVSLQPQPPSSADLDQVRARATELHRATSQARATLVPPTPQYPRG